MFYTTNTLHTMDRRINSVLRQLEMPSRLYGYRYIYEALEILLSDPETRYSVVESLYRQIALRHNSGMKNVESAIRTAIRMSWERGDPEIQEEFFGCSRVSAKRPCNSEFILQLYEYLTVENDLIPRSLPTSKRHGRWEL